MTTVYPTRAVLSLLAILMLGGMIAVAQPQAVTRVEGMIKDEASGAPVGCKIYIYGPDGERIRSINSNSKDGTYLLVLNDAGKHKLVLGGHNVARKEFELVVPKSSDFQEIKRDYAVRVFREGTELFAGRVFERNAATFSAQGRQQMASVLEEVNGNQQLQVVLEVYPDEDQLADAQAEAVRTFLQDSLQWEKDMKAYEKKYRRKKEKPEPPAMPVRSAMPKDPNADLVEARKQTLKSFFKDVRNVDIRMTITTKPLPPGAVAKPPSEEEILKELTSKKSSKSSKNAKQNAEQAAEPTHNTLVVKIGEVKRLFGD